MEQYTFTIANNPAEVERLQGRIQTVLQATDIRLRIISAINVAVGEWLENVIQYAYGDGGSHTISVHLTVGAPEIQVQLIDDGKPFNPCDYPALQKADPSKAGAFTGRGIHLIRNLMDEFRHERKDDRNILVLTKHLT